MNINDIKEDVPVKEDDEDNLAMIMDQGILEEFVEQHNGEWTEKEEQQFLSSAFFSCLSALERIFLKCKLHWLKDDFSEQ